MPPTPLLFRASTSRDLRRLAFCRCFPEFYFERRRLRVGFGQGEQRRSRDFWRTAGTEARQGRPDFGAFVPAHTCKVGRPTNGKLCLQCPFFFFGSTIGVVTGWGYVWVSLAGYSLPWRLALVCAFLNPILKFADRGYFEFVRLCSEVVGRFSGLRDSKALPWHYHWSSVRRLGAAGDGFGVPPGVPGGCFGATCPCLPVWHVFRPFVGGGRGSKNLLFTVF